MMVLGFGEASVDLTSVAPKDSVAQEGEVAQGVWRVLSQSDGAKISLSGATGFDIAIIGHGPRLPLLAKRVASELMLQ
jgi:hypothetical protein